MIDAALTGISAVLLAAYLTSGALALRRRGPGRTAAVVAGFCGAVGAVTLAGLAVDQLTDGGGVAVLEQRLGPLAGLAAPTVAFGGPVAAQAATTLALRTAWRAADGAG